MKRNLEETLVIKLQNSDLWNNQIKQDCLKQEVFCAIRNNEIDFYYKGGRLFNFDINGFKTHIKYAAVIEPNGKDYLTQDELKQLKLATDFESNYKRIKENCSKYSGAEALGVSEIYHRNSYLSNNNVVVLDIEVSFESFTEGTQDRIDILFYNTETATLQFVEAKRYSNTEIRSETEPKVISQIKKYENQIKARKNEILIEITNYIKILNSIFKINLPEPKEIDPKVTLLIFGFDNDQKQGRLKKLIVENPFFKGIKSYRKGKISDVVTQNLWNAKEL
jgi:hypothetical protein